MAKMMSPNNALLLYRNLAAAADKGIPFAEVLAISAEDDESFGIDAPAIKALHEALVAETSLSAAMLRLPPVFAPTTVALVAQAETSGCLTEVLNGLAEEQADLARTRSAIKSAVLWPSMVLAGLVTITSLLMIFVMPAFRDVFRSFGADLPGLTLFLLSISDVFVEWWWLILLGVVAGYVAWRRNAIPTRFKLLLERPIFAVPFVRNYLVRIFAAWLMRWLMLVSRVPALLPLVLAHMAQGIHSRVLAAVLEEFARRVGQGTGWGEALDRLPPLPRRVSLQVRLGEKTGDIAAALAQALESAEIELAHALLRFERGLFMVCYLSVGLLVALTVIGMYLPMFKLGSAV